MSQEISIIGFRTGSTDWKNKKAAVAACITASVPVPQELKDYFKDEEHYEDFEDLGPGIRLARIYSGPAKIEHASVTERHRDGMGAFVIDVTKLPKGVRYVACELRH